MSEANSALIVRVNPAPALTPQPVKVVQAQDVGSPRSVDAVIELNQWGVVRLVSALQAWLGGCSVSDATGDSA